MRVLFESESYAPPSHEPRQPGTAEQARQLPRLLARRCGDHGVSPDDRLHCRIALHRSRSGQPSQRPPRSMSSIAKPLHGPSLRWIRSDPEDLIPASARLAAWQNQSPSAGSRMRRSGRSTVRGLTDRPPRAGASSSPMAPRTLRRPARAGPRAARPRRRIRDRAELAHVGVQQLEAAPANGTAVGGHEATRIARAIRSAGRKPLEGLRRPTGRAVGKCAYSGSPQDLRRFVIAHASALDLMFPLER